MYRHKIARTDYGRVWMSFFGLICCLLLGCRVTVDGTPNKTTGASDISSTLTAVSETVTDMRAASSSTSTTATYAHPSGYASLTIDLGLGFQPTNICSTAVIFGLTGTASCGGGESIPPRLSNAHRTKGSDQISQTDEVNTGLSSDYRSIPDITIDNDGSISGGVTFATRPAVNCGTSGSIADRIANCANTWDGKANGNAGQGQWKLVTRNGSNNEVWQDQTTGLLWSSVMSTSLNWCQAAGNKQVNDPSNYCNSATYQPNPLARSACEETGTIPALAAEAIGSTLGNSWSGTYVNQKGGLGELTTPAAVQWRLPTKNDYLQADINGIRFVMPDMAALGSTNIEWTATVAAITPTTAVTFYNIRGSISDMTRTTGTRVRCVGRSAGN